MKSKPATILLAACLLPLAACQSASSKLERATVETGPRFDRDGKFTETPSLTVPIWDSHPPAPRPEPVTPATR